MARLALHRRRLDPINRSIADLYLAHIQPQGRTGLLYPGGRNSGEERYETGAVQLKLLYVFALLHVLVECCKSRVGQ